VAFATCLEIGRIRMPRCSIDWSKPRPLVAPAPVEVRERIAADGAVVEELQDNDVVDAPDTSLPPGIEAIAIASSTATATPAHEERAEALVRQASHLLVCAFVRGAAEMRSTSSTSTTVVNAYLLGQMAAATQSLETGLRNARHRRAGAGDDSNGACRRLDRQREPVSGGGIGPAAAWSAARASLTRAARRTRSCSTWAAPPPRPSSSRTASEDDVGIRIGDGNEHLEPLHQGRRLHAQGSGDRYCEVGAGGGSLASIDHGGCSGWARNRRRDPGPACYGLGNRGRPSPMRMWCSAISARALAGGQLPIDKDKAARAITTHIAENRSASTLAEAAHGIPRSATPRWDGAVRR